jgi:hypothetical protein
LIEVKNVRRIFGYRRKGMWFGWKHEAGWDLLMTTPF